MLLLRYGRYSIHLAYLTPHTDSKTMRGHDKEHAFVFLPLYEIAGEGCSHASCKIEAYDQ